MRIYNIISIMYLKFIINSAKDSYKRRRNPLFIITVNDEKKYEIKRLIYKRRI